MHNVHYSHDVFYMFLLVNIYISQFRDFVYLSGIRDSLFYYKKNKKSTKYGGVNCTDKQLIILNLTMQIK